MRVLVTGGAGFIGSHTVDRLVAAGNDVTVLDVLDPQVHGGADRPRHLETHLRSRSIHFVRGDVRNVDVLAPLVREWDVILPLAAAVGVGQSMYQPHHYCDVNVGGTARLL